MEEYKILITTSGLGSRLGELTKYTNKSLIRIGKKPSISYIIEQYPTEIELVITLGHYGNQVKDFLELVYPHKKFTFINVHPYSGPGSSLLYSILCAKDQLQCPFILHVCDTITFDNIPLPATNWCAGVKFEGSRSQYRTHNSNSNTLFRIAEKGSDHYDRIHIGVCGINSYKEFWNNAQSLYDSNSNNNQWSETHIINKMIDSNIPINSILFTSWMDTGNIEMLEESRKKIYDNFHTLDKIGESVFIFENFVVKFFYNDVTVQNRVTRAKKLNGLVPNITGIKKNFYKYEYVKGVPFSTTINTKKFRKLLSWAEKNLWNHLGKSPEQTSLCKKFYFDKTKFRIKEFLTKNNIKDTTHIINGIEVPPALDMVNSISPDILCTPYVFNFHGDFILENIIDTGSGFSLIDWRQDFGGNLEGGDIYYDFAKLNHNLVFNHNVISKGLFNVEIDGNNVKCDIMRSNIHTECQEILHKFITDKKLSLFKVKLLTPIIWLNMSPLHEHPITTFLFFFGKYNLFRVLNDN